MEKKKRSRFMQRVAAIVLTFCMVLGLTSITEPLDVQAASDPDFYCGAYDSSRNPFAQSNLYGQCTWYAWGRAYEVTGKNLPCRGHAYSWYDAARNAGWDVGSTPRENSVAVWSSGSVGHVAYVESVNGNTVEISEANINPVTYDCQYSLEDGIKYYYGKDSYPIAQMQSLHGSLTGYIYLGAPPAPQGSYMENGYSQAISNGDYHIVSALEGTLLNPGPQCLTISGLPDAKDDNYASAQLWPVLGLKDHVFTVTWLGNGFYKIKLKDSDNKCLDVSGGDTARGTNVQQWEDNGTASQQWAIKVTDDGFGYTIQARCSGYYLDVDGGYTNDGTNIHLWEWNGTNAQKWYFVPWDGGGSASQEMPDGEYEIVPKADNSKAINAAGSNIELNTRRNDGKHIFRVTWLGNGYYKIIDKNSGLSLDVADGKCTDANAQLCRWSEGTNNAQQWLIKSCGDGSYYNIISKINGAYVDLAWGNTEAGTNIGVCVGWGTGGGDAQKWRFIPWGESIGQTIEDGEYRIVPQSDDSKTLSAAGNGTASGTNLELNSAQDGEKQVFDIAYSGGGYYSLIDRNSGLSLRAVGDEYGSKVQLGESGTDRQQQWMIKPCGDGSYNMISNYNGLYLDWGKLTDEANVWLWFGNDTKMQKWEFVPFIKSMEVESIRLNKNALTILIGTQSSLDASVSPVTATDKTLTWESSNPSVADVDNSGIVTAKSAGTATITVKSVNGKTASCRITVKEEHTHVYTVAWKSDAECHWKECECGEKAEESAHGFAWIIDTAATKESTGIKHEECGTCGYKRSLGTVIEKLNAVCAHAYKTIITPATTQANGSIVEKCRKCGNEKSKTVIYAVNNMALSKTVYTYNGKTQKLSAAVKDSSGKALVNNVDYTLSFPKGMKNVGRYTVTVTLKGNYSGTISETFDIVPKGTSISKVTAKKKGFTIKWKKQRKQTTGYEIAYSTSSKFSKKSTKIMAAGKSRATSKTISKLKAKKKYYVRIRTYKTVKLSGKSVKLYSGWSKAKAVTIKK